MTIHHTTVAWRQTCRLLPLETAAKLALSRPATRPAPDRLVHGWPKLSEDRTTLRQRVRTAAGEAGELEVWRVYVAPWDGDEGEGILFRGSQTPHHRVCVSLRVPGRGVRVWSGTSSLGALGKAVDGNLPPTWRAELTLLQLRHLGRIIEERMRLRATLPPAPFTPE